jgi:hypothetical protein
MRARPIAYGLVAATALTGLAGCSKPGPDVSPLPTMSAPPGPPASQRSLPPATHKWSAATVTCPTTTAEAAHRLKIDGTATQTRASGDADLGRIVECRWGPDDYSATAMTVKLTVAGNQAGADAGWQFISTNLVKPQPLPGVGEEAFVSQPLDGRGIQVDVRSGNAYAVIHLIPATGAADGQAELREAAPALAADVLDDLVPA